MLRALLYALAILHLGPGFAFTLLAFGCEPSDPMLGHICERDSFAAFFNITLVAWASLSLALLAHLGWRRYRLARS